MKPIKLFSVLFVIVMLVLSSCNLPDEQDPPSDTGDDPGAEEMAQTMIALTKQLALTAIAGFTPTPTITPVTFVTPKLTVRIATNRRTGPDVNYPFVMLFDPSMSAPIVGKYSPSDYWIITMPNGGTCWLWGEYATVEGDTNTLPEMTPPQLVISVQPTEEPDSNTNGNSNSANNDTDNTSSIPDAPTDPKADTNCAGGRTDLLTWHASEGADGYYIYWGRNVEQVTNAQARGGLILSYTIQPGNIETPITYNIAAYNAAGKSGYATVEALGCP